MHLSEVLNPGKSTSLTLDEKLYAKARGLPPENPEVRKNLFLRFGGFHTTKNFMSIIGNHFTDSGLQEI